MTTTLAEHDRPTALSQPSEPHLRRRSRRLGRIRLAVLGLVLLPITLAWVYPFVWMVSASVKDNSEIFAGLNPFTSVVRLDNYVRAWQQAHVGQYFLNTVLVTAGSIVITLFAVSTIGYVLGRYRFPGKTIIIGLFAAAVFLPEGYTIIPIFDLLKSLHLSSSLVGLTLAESGGAHVIAILLFTAYFRQLPAELEESAKVDGAGFVRTFLMIYLPLAKPVIATVTILQFMHAWNDFLLPLVMTLSRPELRTLSVGIYAFQGDNFTDWSGMAAAATISLLPIIVLFLVLQRYFVEGIAGAVKQ
ncbi:carbohydrate ABC transporter permease [Microlunatus soli]|uniref:Carbohydrate ABC transporter membrane protein 2, CUT1 family n=1 Tax=Microlunatus soli TaxID=630515 RepID=A0A1H1U4U4_9ACTN|nr:carbohydrate ABC transporter permease [Microlunatus soli]SDS67444.1 carbohydrate ABC transporter membrane protein 2, CUT1 family [Microlunatus soli]